MNLKVRVTGAKPYEAEISIAAQTNVSFSGSATIDTYKAAIHNRLFTVMASFNMMSLLTVSNIPEPQLEQTVINVEAAIRLYLHQFVSLESLPSDAIGKFPAEKILTQLGFK